MRGPLRFAFAAAALLAVGPGVAAQPASDPSPAPAAGADDEDVRKERARRHYVEARRQHEAGEYREAAANYLAAYGELSKPAFLYNAAQVFRLGGERQKALEHYRRYLELDPDGEGAPLAREFVASIEEKLAAGTSDGENPPAPGDTPAPDPAIGSPEPAEDSPLAVISDASVEARGRSKRIAGLGVAGVGVALIGAGIGFGLHARSLSSEASEFRGPYGGDLEDLYDRGEAANRNLVILVSAGALTAAAGGVLYFLGIRDRARAHRDLEIFAGPASGGWMLGIDTRWE
jgi:tetratricopeptide (TPR) repeat protein